MSETELKVSQEADGNFRHELLLNGEQVSNLWVCDLTMRIGVSSVRMGGIAGVGTKSEHRGKGYSRRVLENCVTWMAENGFDCSILFGISNYYNKYGYLPCLPECYVEVPTRTALAAPKTLHARPRRDEDIPALLAIYQAMNAEQNGSIVRAEKSFRSTQGSDYNRRAEYVLFSDADESPVAYIAYDATDDSNPIDYELVVAEVGAASPRYFSDIVRWAAEKADAMHLGEIKFQLPPDCPFLTYLTAFGAEAKTVFPYMDSGMGRLTRLVPFLEATLPEWTRRAQQTLGLPSGRTLRLETDLGGVSLQWTGSAVEIVPAAATDETLRLPQHRLMQLAIGYYGLSDSLLFPEATIEGEPTLGAALFPRRLPYLWRPDHF